jgi:phage-related minor tail protein
MYQPAGIVHAGEFVFSQAAVRNIGVANLEFAHNMAKTGRGYADGGYVTAGSGAVFGSGGMPIVQFSPYDRQLLAEIRDAAAANKLTRATLAGVASQSNANNANRRST